MNRDESLYDHVFDLSHDFIHVHIILPEPFKHFLEGALVPGVVIGALRLLEVFVLLVDGVVRQVHEEIVHILLVCGGQVDRLVLVCRKSYQAVVVEENFEWIAAQDQHIESQIVL